MAKPFLKWAGGKRNLIQTLCTYFPSKFNTYYEPFLGGGAVFFYLCTQNLVSKSILSDSNVNLMYAYSAVKNYVNPLIKELDKLSKAFYTRKRLSSKTTPEQYYYHMRKVYNTQKEGLVPQVARFLFLNKTCFNGLYRTNRKGKFNVPCGCCIKPVICDEVVLRATNKLLQNSTLAHSDFESVVSGAKKGDFVYLDPPYYPIKKHSLVGHWPNIFTIKDQERLAKVFKELKNRGVVVVESNSDTPEVRNLYKNMRFVRVQQNRSIGGHRETRKKGKDLIIL